MSENLEQTQTDDLDAFSTEFFGQNEAEPEAEPQTSGDTEGAEDEPEVDETDEVDAEQDAETGESTESQETEEDEDEGEPEAPQPKGKPTVQERINELVRQREEAKREGQAALEALRKEFEEKLAAATAPKAETPKEEGEPSPTDTNEDGTPKYELGEFDPQYIRDLTKYTLNQERKALEARAAEEAQRTQAEQARVAMVTAWNEKVEAATAAMPDFMEKGGALLAEFDGLDSGYAQYLSNLFMSMDKGPDVLYYLANNPDEARQIVNSGAQKATLALGRIEAKFIEDAARKTLAKPKQSKAPPPPPAAARSRGSNGAFIAVAPDTDDLDAFTKEFFKKK